MAKKKSKKLTDLTVVGLSLTLFASSCAGATENVPGGNNTSPVVGPNTETEPHAPNTEIDTHDSGTSTEVHIHDYETTWSHDSKNHWHKCKSCDATKDVTPHGFGEWEIVTPATTTSTGLKRRVCTTCGYVEEEIIPLHEHTFSSEWEHDETHHWHPSTCGHDEEKSAYSEHRYGEVVVSKESTTTEEGEGYEVCLDCGYKHDVVIPLHVHTFSSEWESNDTYHWHNSTCHPGEKSELSSHTYKEVSRVSKNGQDIITYECSVCHKTKTITQTNSVYYLFTTLDGEKVAYMRGSFNGTSFVMNDYASDDAGELYKIIGFDSSFSFGSSVKSITLNNFITTFSLAMVKSTLDSFYIPHNITSFTNYSSFSNHKTLVYYEGSLKDWLTTIYFETVDSNPCSTIAKKFFLLDENGDVTMNNHQFSELVDLVIPEDITSINHFAFVTFSGERIVIPATLKSHGRFLLTKREMGRSDTDTGFQLYYKGTLNDYFDIQYTGSNGLLCNAIGRFYLLDEQGETIYENEHYSLIRDLVVPEGIEVINEGQIYAPFDSVTLPSSLTEIKACNINTKVIKYNGTLDDFASVKKDNNYQFETFETDKKYVDLYTLNSSNEFELVEGDVYINAPSIAPNAFRHVNNITSVTLGDKVEEIKLYAFRELPTLEKVRIVGKEGFTINSDAFSELENLKEVYISNNAGSIKFGSFYHCSAIEKLTTPFFSDDEIQSIGSFFGYSSSTYYYSGNMKEINVTSNKPLGQNFIFGKAHPNYQTAGFPNLEKVTLAEGITDIPDNFLYLLDKITEFNIPSTVKTIGSQAFRGTSITSITLPEGLESIGSSCFRELNMEEITLPSTLITLGGYAFANTKISSITLPNGLDSIGNGAFAYTDLSEISIPSSVTKVGMGAFAYTDLVEAVIPDTVTSIGHNLFYGCDKLKKAYIGDGVECLRFGIFYGCTSLEEIDLVDTYLVCGDLHDIYNRPKKFPRNLEYLFYNTGSYSTAPSESTFESKPFQVGSTTYFDTESLKKITLRNVDDASSGHYSLYTVNKHLNLSNVEYLEYKGNYLTIYNGATNLFAYLPNLKTLKINSSNLTLTDGALKGLTSLECLVLPHTYIKNRSNQTYTGKLEELFYVYNATSKMYEYDESVTPIHLKTVVIDGLYVNQTLSADTFEHFDELENIVIGRNIDAFTFSNLPEGCNVYYNGTMSDIFTMIQNHPEYNPLKDIANLYFLDDENGDIEFNGHKYVAKSSIRSIRVAEGTTSIEDYYFEGLEGLEELYIPTSVTSIGTGIVKGCNNLTKITLPFVGEERTTGQPLTYLFDGTVPSSLKELIFNDNSTLHKDLLKNMSTLEEVSFVEGTDLLVLEGAKSNYLKFKVFLDERLDEALGKSTFTTDKNFFLLFNNLYLLDDNGDTTYLGKKYSNLMTLDEYTYGESVARVYANGLKGTRIKKIVIPNTVTTLDKGVFTDARTVEEISVPFLGSTIEDTSNAHLGYLFGYNKQVSFIEGAYEWNSFRNLKTIRITGDITSIEKYAFYYTKGLESIILPETVTTIEQYAFYEDRLTNLYLPHSLESVKSYAFSGTVENVYFNMNFDEYQTLAPASLPTLTNLYFVDPEGDVSFNGKTFSALEELEITLEQGTSMTLQKMTFLKKVVVKGDITTLPNNFFNGCTSLEEVVLPDTITTIGANCFYNCKSLASITLPASCTAIYADAFSGCSALKNINTENITLINNYAFRGCSSLTSFTFNENIRKLGNAVFQNCDLRSVDLKNMTNLNSNNFGTDMFNGNVNLASATLPSTLTAIPSATFRGCAALEHFDFTNFTEIGDYAFYGCSALTDIDITHVVTVKAEAFNGCTNITSLGAHFNENSALTTVGSNSFRNIRISSFVVPSGVTNITAGLLADNPNLTSVTLHNKVKSIESNAFNGCTNLASVNLPEGLTTIDYYAFKDCTSLPELELPSTLISLSSSAFSGCSFGTVTKYEGASYFQIGDNPYYFFCGLSSGYADDYVTHEDTVKVGAFTLTYSRSMTSITFTNKVEAIGSITLSSINTLTTLTMADSVKYLGTTKLTLTNLTNLTVSNSLEHVETITFNNNKSLNLYEGFYYVGSSDNPYYMLVKPERAGSKAINIHPDCKVIAGTAFNSVTPTGNFAIPEGVEVIGVGAFKSLYGNVKVTLPSTLKFINANLGCNSKYVEFNYSGSVEDFNLIKLEENTDSSVYEVTIKCNDGEIKIAK